MPAPRHIVLIILFWVATAGWFFYREFWPSLRPDEPPPYTIDLVDEARRVPIAWTVHRGENEQRVATALTSVEYREKDDTFDLSGTVIYVKPLFFKVDRLRITTIYRVTRDGALRNIEGEIFLMLRFEQITYEVKAHIGGPVREGRFFPEGELSYPGGEEKLTMDPVLLTGRGSVLNPQHPVNRVLGLRPGQHWQVPLFEPFTIALSQARPGPKAQPLVRGALNLFGQLLSRSGAGSGIQTLQAEVLPEPQKLLWAGRTEQCLVIDYHGQDLNFKTWVRESDGIVLQQEGTFLGDRLVLKRNP